MEEEYKKTIEELESIIEKKDLEIDKLESVLEVIIDHVGSINYQLKIR